MEHAAGASAVESARRAGYSPKGGAPYKLLAEPRTAELVALLREQARRRARVTLEGQILRIQKLGRDAEAAGDRGAALRAEEMINKLAALYQPEVVVNNNNLSFDLSSIDPAEMAAAARFVHEIRPRLTGQAIDAEVTPIDHPPVTSSAQVLDITRRALGADGKKPDAA